MYLTRGFQKALVLCLAIILILASALPAAAADKTLTITGDGVEHEVTFTYTELAAMTGNISRNTYSAWNTWPTQKTYYAQGVALSALLKQAGLKDDATTINVAAAPDPGAAVGYNATFLLEDLLAQRYTFEGGRSAASAIIALRLSEKDMNSLEDTDLWLIYGQLAAQEQTTVNFVQFVRTITVTCDPVRQLPQPEATAERSASSGQYAVTLRSSNVNAKIYYTTDGSTPTVNSKMYNISAAHWQPQLNVPFTVSGDAQVKAIAVVNGYKNSEILSFTPATLGKEEPATPPSATTPTPTPTPTPAAPAPKPAGSGIKVVVDGKALTFDVPPQNINGRVLLPLRVIFEEMGASIDYDNSTNTVTATKGDTVVVLTIGSTSPTINGKVVTIDQPGIIVDGRTLAPLRFVAEAFGGTVDWDSATQTAVIQGAGIYSN